MTRDVAADDRLNNDIRGVAVRAYHPTSCLAAPVHYPPSSRRQFFTNQRMLFASAGIRRRVGRRLTKDAVDISPASPRGIIACVCRCRLSVTSDRALLPAL